MMTRIWIDIATSPHVADVMLCHHVHFITQVRNARERLRTLHLVRTYRQKNDLGQLSTLICKWRHVCQLILLELQSKPTITLGAPVSLRQLIDGLGIPRMCKHYRHRCTVIVLLVLLL